MLWQLQVSHYVEKVRCWTSADERTAGGALYTTFTGYPLYAHRSERPRMRCSPMISASSARRPGSARR